MNSLPPLINEAELQARELWFAARQQSYELTQKLTYFVISVELVFCGYMLLNADKLNVIHGASYIFLTCGIAAIFGILWRFFYNQTYHNNAHGTQGQSHQTICRIQITCYWIYVALSTIALIWILVAGFSYLNAFNNPDKLHNFSKSSLAQPPVSLSAGTPPSEAKLAPIPAAIALEATKNKSTTP